MTTVLRLVLDQLVDVVDADTAEAALEVARALVATAPARCEVAAIVPSDAGDDRTDAALLTGPTGLAGLVGPAGAAGVGEVTRAPFPRSGLLTSWPLGIAPGASGGLIHAPSLLAPLVKHDRAHANDQTVITLWDLAAWESPSGLPRATVLAHRALLKRAEKHADAVVVPAYAIADRLAEIAPRLASRTRVISGAAPEGFRVPTDAVGRRRALGVPDRVAVVVGGTADQLRGVLEVVAGDADVSIVVFDPPAEAIGVVQEAGLDAGRVIVPGALEPADRAAVLDAASLVVGLSECSAFPWRLVEALTLGVPVVAVASPVHEEILLDGAVTAPATELRAAAARILSTPDDAHRWSIRAADRGRAFSWRDHAERVWGLHAEL